MNTFDIQFFGKYVPEWQELLHVIHTHVIVIVLELVVKICLFALIPSVFYFYSPVIRDFIPFFYFEFYLIFLYIKLVYDLFDWYNDVWVVTNEWVINVKRSFLKTNSDSVNFENVEWIWVEQHGLMDKIFGKGDLIIHKIWDDTFRLKDAAKPYKSVDLLESMEKEEKDIDKERFQLILQTLSGAIGDYVETNKWFLKKQRKNDAVKKQIIDWALHSPGHLDLREDEHE